MPTLGFLKKKRTREGNTDPAQPSNPTSPVAPIATKTFDQSSASLAQPHLVATQASPQPPVPSKQDMSGLAAGAATMNTLPNQHGYTPSQQTPSPGTESQNLPHIANLINHPQVDGASSYRQAQIAGSRYTPSPGNGNVGAGISPEGGILQQGSMAVSQLGMQQQSQQYQQQYQQQHQQQLAQQPPQIPQAQAQPPQEQARVTKGKYSLADFQMLQTLGTGSFGRVHLVQSRHNQRFYAVKVLKKAQVVKMKQVEHTNDERRMLGEVKHPFLITLWGTFQDARNLYMVMDFVEGGELFSLLRKSGVSLPFPS